MKNNVGWAWLFLTFASLALFVAGLVFLIMGVMHGQNAKVYEILGKSIGSPVIGLIFIFLGVAFIFIGITKTVHNMPEETQREFRNLGTAYAYISPAIMGMIVLVFFPLVFGVWVAFTNYKRDIPLSEAKFTFLDRFIEVFTSSNSDFWNTFFINIWWTIVNIVLAVSIGVILALILNREGMRFKKIYRTVLILPWAVPSYVTALMWRALFQKDLGAINQILSPIYDLLHVEPLFWLSKSYFNVGGFFNSIPGIGSALYNMFTFNGYLVSLPFVSVVIVNVWLGFPFMMVVALGGLQSISATFYEAAEIDGATKWEQFKFITVPLLKPTMIPSIILSIIWTFNQFNVIYLITTQDKMSILVVSAYREAFEKGKYAYAAAYSVVIFVILAAYSIITMKMSKATEEVY